MVGGGEIKQGRVLPVASKAPSPCLQALLGDQPAQGLRGLGGELARRWSTVGSSGPGRCGCEWGALRSAGPAAPCPSSFST